MTVNCWIMCYSGRGMSPCTLNSSDLFGDFPPISVTIYVGITKSYPVQHFGQALCCLLSILIKRPTSLETRSHRPRLFECMCIHIEILFGQESTINHDLIEKNASNRSSTAPESTPREDPAPCGKQNGTLYLCV